MKNVQMAIWEMSPRECPALASLVLALCPCLPILQFPATEEVVWCTVCVKKITRAQTAKGVPQVTMETP